MLLARTDDGRWGTFRFTCSNEPGAWRPINDTSCTTPSGPSDAFAWVAKVDPFVVEGNRQFRPSNGPPALNTGLYAKEYNEVKDLGATAEAPEPTSKTRWSPSSTRHPVEHVLPVVPHACATRSGLDVAEQARLFGTFGTRLGGHVHHLLGGQGALEQLAPA